MFNQDTLIGYITFRFCSFNSSSHFSEPMASNPKQPSQLTQQPTLADEQHQHTFSSSFSSSSSLYPLLLPLLPPSSHWNTWWKGVKESGWLKCSVVWEIVCNFEFDLNLLKHTKLNENVSTLFDLHENKVKNPKQKRRFLKYHIIAIHYIFFRIYSWHEDIIMWDNNLFLNIRYFFFFLI